MKCLICGSPIPEGSEKCSYCGTEFSRDGIKVEVKKGEESRPLTAEGLGLKRLKKSVPPPKSKGWEEIIADLEREYGRDEEGVTSAPETRYDEDALKELMLIPGVSKEQAKLLYDIGYTSLEDVLRGALHGYDDADTLARIIAMRFKVGKKEDLTEVRIRCVSCKTLVRVSQERCPVCNTPISAITLTEDDAKKKIEEHAGNVLRAISEDVFFRGISPELKKGIITELKDLVPEEVKRREKLKEMWIAKLKVLRARGFAVDELQRLLEENFDEFLKRSNEFLSLTGEKGKPSEEERAASKHTGWCTNCGEKWVPGKAECMNCRKPLTAMKRCGVCGIPLKPAMRKCPACKKEVST